MKAREVRRRTEEIVKRREKIERAKKSAMAEASRIDGIRYAKEKLYPKLQDVILNASNKGDFRVSFFIREMLDNGYVDFEWSIENEIFVKSVAERLSSLLMVDGYDIYKIECKMLYVGDKQRRKIYSGEIVIGW